MRAGWCFVGGLACALTFARTARAYERQQHLGLSLGGMTFSTTGGGTPLGGDVGLHYNYGFSDALTIVVEADVSAFAHGTPPKSPAPEPGLVTTGGAGLLYVFDVLRWVPYAGAIAGAGYFTGGYMTKGLVTPDLQIAVGVDYQITRSWTVGAAYRQHIFLTQTGTYPNANALGLRVEYVWGW